MKAMKRGWVALLTALCLAFAVRALLLIDATALWGDGYTQRWQEFSA